MRLTNMTIILHHFDLNFTCCEACALNRVAVTPEETDYVYAVELYPHEVVTCNDCQQDVVGQEATPAKVKYYQ